MANKTFFTYDEQIEKLKKEKQLVISDPEFAKNTLQKLSYFSLIGGYYFESNYCLTQQL